MNSRKNPPRRFVVPAASLALALAASGCATLFSRDDGNSAGKPESMGGKEAYSASEPGDPERLKDDKIQHLESTVTALNSRIQELEGKLQATQNRPDLSGIERRQKNDGTEAGTEIRASVAATDPGAGYVNDERFRAFQQGKILFDQEKYPEAVLAFSAFIERAADHPLAGSAQYYIGESYYLQGDYAVADQEFQRVVARYPGSPRASYALVRLAQSTAKLGKADESRRYRAQAEGLYPRSPALYGLRELSTGAAATAASAIEKPTVPEISIPEVAAPNIEAPTVPAPRIEAPGMIPSSDLDGPPGGG